MGRCGPAQATGESTVTTQLADAIRRLLAMWESGQMPEAVAAALIRRQGPARPCERWSLGNRLLLWAYGTSDARGFRQWQEVGRYVKRGARAIYILAPITRTVTVIATDPATGETTEKQEVRVIGFRPIPVFCIEDTEGAPLPEPNYTPAQLPPLFDVARAWGIDVRWAPPEAPGVYGWYAPGQNRMGLHTYDPGTFWHELAHAAHHRIRSLRPGQDPQQEIVAETCAATLAVLYGYPGRIARAREYVAAYATVPPQQAARAVLRVLHEVEQVLTLILDTAATVAWKAESGAA